MLYWGTTPRSLKFTARSSWQTTWFLGFFYRFQTHLGCRWVLEMTVVDPHGIPLPKAGENQQNYWNVAVWNRSLSPHDNISMDTELAMKGGMNWCCASRSLQAHWKVKLIKHDLLGCYLFRTHLGCMCVLQMTAVDTLLVGYHFTTHRKGSVCHFSLGGGGGNYPLGIPLITPLSQRCSESTQLLKFSSVEHQLQPPW